MPYLHRDDSKESLYCISTKPMRKRAGGSVWTHAGTKTEEVLHSPPEMWENLFSIHLKPGAGPVLISDLEVIPK